MLKLSAFLVASASAQTLCGTDASSSNLVIEEVPADGNVPALRVMSSNGCPGYDWTDQTTPNDATETSVSMALLLEPQFCVTPETVGLSRPIMGLIGISLNGVAIYGPSDAFGQDAYVEEAETFGGCWSHAQEQGQEHYHSDMPCIYEDDDSTHSPVLGFMVDGIPIYGPRGDGGDVPTDLDSCGGHDSDSGAGYHYHIAGTFDADGALVPEYPYTVDCLVGVVPAPLSDVNQELAALADCEIDDSVSYDYSALLGTAAIDMSSVGSVVGSSGSSGSSASGSVAVDDDGSSVDGPDPVIAFWEDAACTVPAGELNAFPVADGEATCLQTDDFECDVPDESLAGRVVGHLRRSRGRGLKFADFSGSSIAFMCNADQPGDAVWADCSGSGCDSCDDSELFSMADTYEAFGSGCQSLGGLYDSVVEGQEERVCDSLRPLYVTVSC